MRVKLISLIFVILVVSGAVFSSEAFKVTGVSLSVSEREFSGSCPHRFVFTGRITANREGTARYRWLRSDGSVGSEETLVFTTAGTKTVSTYWELGGGMATYRDRWMQLEIVAPNSRLSNQAEFNLKCIPLARIELPKRYTISGTIISAAGSHNDWLNGLQVKVKLSKDSRLVDSKILTFRNEGLCYYSFVLLDAPGRYALEVETIHPTDPDLWYICFVGVDPLSLAVDLSETAPVATGRNFSLTWSWFHGTREEHEGEPPCW